jgi:RND family efflux transporter MFP subunit
MGIAKLFGVLLLLALAFAGGVAWRTWAGAQKKSERTVLYYVDPMHPWYKSDKPGIAPDCGMKLKPVYQGDQEPSATDTRKPLYYRDPKQPSYQANAPGINPETGSDLEPVYDETPANAIALNADQQNLLGVTFGTPQFTSAAQTVHSVGRIAVDETRIERVHSKTEGWIEKTFVNYTGELIQKGQPLLTLYSPELLASQQEYLLALKARETMHHSSVPSMAGSGETLVAAARQRLSLWDLTAQQIEEIETTGKPIKSVTLYSPAAGYVMEREAFPNQKIGPEMKLYTIADLSRVWVMADVYEADAPSIRVGTTARVTMNGSGRAFVAHVTNIQPTVESATRTLKARLELENPGYALKPDMYVDVDFTTGGGSRLTVPAEAVIDTGVTKTVYVDRGGTANQLRAIEPRTVETGARLGDRIEITRGLKPTDRIVTSGAFLLNSESQMRTSLGNSQPVNAQPVITPPVNTQPANAGKANGGPQ